MENIMKKYVLTIVSFVLIFNYQAFGQIKDAGMGVRARPLDLSSVRLLGGALKQAQDLDAKYLLELEPDVGRHGRRTFEGASGLHRQGAKGSPGKTRRRLSLCSGGCTGVL